jgi:hypothetical protein
MAVKTRRVMDKNWANSVSDRVYAVHHVGYEEKRPNLKLKFQIMSKDATACTSALAQLDELIKDKDKVILLGERMDPLLVSCYMQYRHVLYNKLRTDNANPKEVLRLFQVQNPIGICFIVTR